MNVKVKKVMRLRDRSSKEESRVVGGFSESGYGFEVVDTDGEALGYFGPDKYESIVFELHFTGDEPSPR